MVWFLRLSTPPRCSAMVWKSARIWHGWNSSVSAFTTGWVEYLAISTQHGPDQRCATHAVGHTVKHASRVGHRFATAQLGAGLVNDSADTTEFGHANGEAGAGTGTGLVENHGDALRVSERLVIETVLWNLMASSSTCFCSSWFRSSSRSIWRSSGVAIGIEAPFKFFGFVRDQSLGRSDGILARMDTA